MANIGATELNRIRTEIINSGEVLDFENRIPVATQDNLKDMGQALFSYRPALNAFINSEYELYSVNVTSTLDNSENFFIISLLIPTKRLLINLSYGGLATNPYLYLLLLKFTLVSSSISA